VSDTLAPRATSGARDESAQTKMIMTRDSDLATL